MIARKGNSKNWAPKLRPLYLATIAAWLLPGAALAQFALEEPTKPPVDPDKVAELTQWSNEIEGGLMYVSDPSFKFGEYSGLTDDGVYGILNFSIHKHNPYDSGNANYLDVTGRNLGLDSREFHFEMGEQGNYKLFLDYNQIPKNNSDSGQTIFQGVGSSYLTLPGGWTLSGGGGNTAGLPSLEASLHPVDIETERKRFDVGMGKVLNSNWSFKLKYRHEEKDGTKTIGGVMGNSGGNPRSVILPEPVDYTTEQVDAVLSYSDKKAQFQIAYYGSLFRDGNSSLTWQNPYGAINGWDSSAGFAAGGLGSLSTPPDNEFHQVSVLGGYNLSDRTRVTADLALGKMTQDDSFLPYSANPTLAASVTQPLPQDSLDGEIETTLFNLRINSRPSANFYWKASYRYDDRDNKTHHNEYVYIGGDTTDQDTSVTSSRRRFNEPYSRTDHVYRADAGYKVAKNTDLTAGLERQDIDRTYTEREEATEDTFRLGLKSRFGNGMTGGVRYQRSERDGSTYYGEEPFLSSYSPAYTATVPGMWENHPDLRKFYLADRTRDKATVFGNVMLSEMWSFGFNANYLNDDYKESEKGLTESKTTSFNIDTTFMPMEGTSLYAFYSHEKMSADQDGRAFSGTAKLAQAADPNRDWSAAHDDRVDTVGFGLKRILNDRWDVGADYVYAKTKSDVDVTTGSALSSEPLPTATTRLNSLGLYANYKWKKNLTLKVQYVYEDYKSEDWALDGVDPNTLANVITLGEDSPDYTVHLIGVSVSYRYF